MKKYIFLLLIGFNLIGYTQNRYHIDDFECDSYECYVSEYIDGKWGKSLLNGEVYNDCGTVGRYEDGKKEGIHRKWYEDRGWDEDCQLKSETNFSNGIIYGVSKGWFKNGQIDNVTYYDISGTNKNWYENGQLRWKCYYINGINNLKKDGLEEMWSRNGKKVYEINWKDGLKNGPYKEWSRGQLSEFYYIDDVLIKP
jgi:antitoxin component YwqK of YwqJK toxin-antitoxin module